MNLKLKGVRIEKVCGMFNITPARGGIELAVDPDGDVWAYTREGVVVLDTPAVAAAALIAGRVRRGYLDPAE